MIYFDNAATTFPKPSAVLHGMTAFMKKSGGNPGRSSHPLAYAAAEAVYDTREKIAAFFDSTKPENTVFTENCTHALQLVLHGILKKGDHVLRSDLEHNSVLRNLAYLEKTEGITVEMFHALQNDEDVLAEIDGKIRENTRAVVCTHASNICPKVLPIREIGKLCQDKHILFIVDGAQSVGIQEISMKKDGISALCAPGHKGLYGPQGSGFALFADDFDFSLLSPTVFGGNGRNSMEREMGNVCPDSYEAGTLQVPSIVGLSSGLDFVRRVGIRNIREKENAVYLKIRDGLLAMGNITVYLPEKEEGSVLLFNKTGENASNLAMRLGELGICTRAGLHCAPTAHAALHTGGDAVRISFSYFNTEKEGETFLSLLSHL